jgi:hypothetical protein
MYLELETTLVPFRCHFPTVTAIGEQHVALCVYHGKGKYMGKRKTEVRTAATPVLASERLEHEYGSIPFQSCAELKYIKIQERLKFTKVE